MPIADRLLLAGWLPMGDLPEGVYEALRTERLQRQLALAAGLEPRFPFLCLGQASHVEHRGERPIAITWRLARPMPGEVFRLASVVAG